MIPGDIFRAKVIRLAQRMGWDPEKSTADYFEIVERGPAALEFIEARVAALEKAIRRFRDAPVEVGKSTGPIVGAYQDLMAMVADQREDGNAKEDPDVPPT